MTSSCFPSPSCPGLWEPKAVTTIITQPIHNIPDLAVTSVITLPNPSREEAQGLSDNSMYRDKLNVLYVWEVKMLTNLHLHTTSGSADTGIHHFLWNLIFWRGRTAAVACTHIHTHTHIPPHPLSNQLGKVFILPQTGMWHGTFDPGVAGLGPKTGCSPFAWCEPKRMHQKSNFKKH